MKLRDNKKNVFKNKLRLFNCSDNDSVLSEKSQKLADKLFEKWLIEKSNTYVNNIWDDKSVIAYKNICDNYLSSKDNKFTDNYLYSSRKFFSVIGACVGLGSAIVYNLFNKAWTVKNSSGYKNALHNFYTEKANELNNSNYNHTFNGNGDLNSEVNDLFYSSFEAGKFGNINIDSRYEAFYFDYKNTNGFGISEGVAKIYKDCSNSIDMPIIDYNVIPSTAVCFAVFALIAYYPYIKNCIKYKTQSNQIQIKAKAKELLIEKIKDYDNSILIEK